MKVAIVDYSVGNLNSVRNMVRKLGGEAEFVTTADEILAADKLILPGVGAFDAAMGKLRERDLVEPLRRAALGRRTPLLGICLGMQLLTRSSEEGELEGLGVVPARTVRFRFPPGTALPIPNMGWRNVSPARDHPLLRELPERPRFYFANSYHAELDERSGALLTCQYGYEFVAGFAFDNIAGFQFHPEKSHAYGMKLFSAFLAL